MDADQIAALLALPAASRVDRRVPKSLLAGSGATTAADRKLVAAGIESLSWVAALKPGNTGVAALRDDRRDYREIQVLRLEVRGAARDRLRTLVHRAVPYPVLLVTVGAEVTASTAHLRHSQGAAGETVLESAVEVATLPGATAAPGWWSDAAAALALAAQPARDLHDVYEGWRSVLLAIRCAERSGRFRLDRNRAAVEKRRTALARCEEIEKEIRRVRSAARRTPQRARQVTYTAELRRLERELVSARALI